MLSIVRAERTKRDDLKRCADDFEYFADRALSIRTKSGSIERLKLNVAQLALHKRLEEQLKSTGRIRAIVLKGRQQGVSTYVEGRFYWRVTHRPGVMAYILTHEQEATNNLFAMAQRYHELAPDDMKPQTEASNAKELIFSGLDSGYKIGTAGSRGTGRGTTLQYFHGSEVAHWPHAETHLSGVLQAVPDATGTEVILESTANGVGDVFHQYWQDAESGKGDYIPIFIPWYWQPEYRRSATGIELTAEEVALSRLYGLDNEQIAWRRGKIHELKSEALFQQEYPCTASEAFISSGRTVFEKAWMMAAEAECYSPKYRASVSGKSIARRDDGELRVWVDPEPGKRYAIGADVAEGLAHGDYSCADVLSVPDGHQVAQWHGHISPDRFADVLAALGKRYNSALIGVERNNHGLTTVTKLRDDGYRNLYAQQELDHRGGDKEQRKVGWLTTEKSKYKIIDQLAAELRDGDHGIACRETVMEMRTYMVSDNGSYNAKPGCYDDRVMSRAIAGEMVRVYSTHSRVSNKTYKPVKQYGDPVGGY